MQHQGGNGPWPAKRTFRKLFHEMLKDIYFAEKKILSALPEMAEAA
jgi:ferritin-like metal-binding protein YciE